MPGLNFDMHTLSSHNYKECNFEREEDFSVCIITFTKDHSPVTIVHNKWHKHPHLEVLDKFYQAMSDSRGEELVEALSGSEGHTALKILDRLPLVKKLAEKVRKVIFKDPSEILDSNSPTCLKYQLRIIGEVKDVKHSQEMLVKRFSEHIPKIFLSKQFQNPLGYSILASLMAYFN